MLRSMFTAISALNIHQSFMDVIADNLANANTTGYKASRVIFQDQFAQLMSAGAPPSATSGGINPTQIGLGAQIGYISPIFTQGSLQNTGRNLDLAMQGDGFFVYSNGNGQYFSRDGSLSVDANGYLVNASNGMRAQGWQAAAGATTVNTNGPIGGITVPNNATLAQATTTATLGGNLNSSVANGSTFDTTMGVYNFLGALHSVTMRYTRTGANAWGYQVTGPAGAAGAGTLTFNAQGQMTNNAVTTAVTVPGSSGAGNVAMTVDMTGVTMLSQASSVSLSSQNGLPAGSLSDIYIGPNTGEVYLLFSNGLKQLVGQLASAKFTNPTGLIRKGENLFQLGLNSGDPQIGTADSGGRGSIVAGYREASNVDMAQEFTNMILAQRGFQASSRVITTSDEMLQELVNLKR